MRSFKRLLTFLLSAALMLTALCFPALADTEGTFPDVPEDAGYAEAVEALAELGIFGGDDRGSFNPDKTITRAECAAVICRMLGVEDEARSMQKQVFDDVPASFWGAGVIAKAAELGIIGGYGNGTFGPNDPVTQEQMIKMLVCANDLEEYAFEAGGWPTGYISVADEYGFTSGLDIIGSASAPRWMVAVLVYNSLYL